MEAFQKSPRPEDRYAKELFDAVQATRMNGWSGDQCRWGKFERLCDGEPSRKRTAMDDKAGNGEMSRSVL